jgi:3,5-epimerase/4-reductase
MKFIIYGHNGWIGKMMCTLLEKEGIDFVGSKCRANNIQDLEKELKEVSPTHIMSFIGRTHGTTEDGKVYTTIDYLEQKGKLFENVRDNLFSPMCLALLAQKNNIHFTYLGTGCIFDYDDVHNFGNEETGFTEEDNPNYFGSSYSIVKGFTDQLMHLCSGNTLNLRIRMPIIDKKEPRNFISKITTYERVCSVPNSMTVLDDLLPVALDMAINNQTGTFNFTNEGLISHNEILEMYREIVDPGFTWKNFTIEEQATILAAGRSNNCLDTNKLTSLYPDLKNIKDSVRDTLVRMKNNSN